ncbi:MAG: ABC transporter ATP-binding protein, partial [Phycisphaerae bacterium]|nr:ABC transporter ATP-binding protein [Phycisphaerae bacterium]NIP55318.1 ABC transporter ATP-binding protein [Phycisphaerae bacterium]NIU11649.1 ABC transporter ATP-binding protein [Phycisphaerae bacterium]NIX31530.1 ABC transporter ATP-binding protein [Phycisphaerae bacterium]
MFSFDMRRQSLASELPHHELQWLEILMVLQNGSSVSLFDEPTAGLAEKETEITADALKLCQRHGLTILVVEHDLKFIKQIADTVTVMHQGTIFFEGSLQSVLNNDDIKHIYLGR